MKKYILAIPLLCLMACHTSKPIVEQTYDHPLLMDKMWAVTSIKGKEIQYPNQGDVAYFVFRRDGKVSGGAGCNQYNGKYSFIGDSIAIIDVASTRMMCPQIKIEETFFKTIPEVVRFKVNKENLKLYDKQKKEVMNCIYLKE